MEATKFLKTTLKNVLLIIPEVFEDHRGIYTETYNEELYAKAFREHGIPEIKFFVDDYSRSTKHVLRGIHGDPKTWKLISCPLGRIYVVIVNCDETSNDFGKWEAFTLSDKNRKQVLVPPMYGTSHLVLSDEAIFQYKQSEYYNPSVLKQFTYRWDEPRFKIWWPIKNPILSQRDELHQ